MPAPPLDTDDVEILRLWFTEWMNGARAYMRGIPLSEIPHPARSARADAWENGWEVMEMEAKDRQFVQQLPEGILDFKPEELATIRREHVEAARDIKPDK